MENSDYRLNAYRKASGSSSSGSTSSSSGSGSKSDKNIRKPVFEKISTENPLNKHDSFKQTVSLNPLENFTVPKDDVYDERESQSQILENASSYLKESGLLKTTKDGRPSDEKDSIYRRVAKFLILIGMDEAAKILPHLTQEQTERIIPEIASIRSITPEESEAILEEFHSLIDRAKEEGGVEKAREILSKAFGEKKAEELISRTLQFPQGNPFDFLEAADPQRIKLLIEGESLGVKTIVLSQIEPKKSAAVINLMKPEEKTKVILRLAKMEKVAPEVMIQIGKTLQEKMLAQNTENSDSLDGKNVLAQILKRMSPEQENSLINTLSETDPDLGEQLRERLFTEEDIVNADDRFIQNLLFTMSDNELACLVCGKSVEFRAKIFRNISKVRGQSVLIEEKTANSFSKTDVERLTAKFYSTLRRAWETGSLFIKGRDDGETYV